MRFDGLVCPIDGNQPGPTAGIYGILRTVVGRHVTGFPTLEAATKSQGRSSILKALNAPYALIIDRLLRWPAGSFAVIEYSSRSDQTILLWICRRRPAAY